MPEKKRQAKNEEPKKPKSPEVVSIERDLERYVALETLAESEGGKIIVDNLASDVISLAEILGAQYKTATHAEILGLCADLDNKLTILRLITRSKKNKELALDALKQAIKEEGDVDE